MSLEVDYPEESAEDLYENAPCGFVSTRIDGKIVKVNRTFENWTGFSRAQLLSDTRFQDLLAPGGKIYYETHFAPLLQMQGSVRELALEIERADGTRLPALINSVTRRDGMGRPQLIRTTVFDASDRRSYEQELLKSKREEQETALQLQRGLLSRSLPRVPGLELEMAYRPGLRGTEVGGDWGDAFVRNENEVVLVVGDVVGHGIAAAVEMGQLRSAVRALSGVGLGPSAVLHALDRYSDRHGVGKMATLVCAQLDCTSGRLDYACAGHPPPLVISPKRAPEFMWSGRSTPISYTADEPPATRPHVLSPQERRCSSSRTGLSSAGRAHSMPAWSVCMPREMTDAVKASPALSRS